MIKLTTFLKHVKYPTSYNGNLVLFPTREGCENFRVRISELYPLTKQQLKTNYRTLDSYLLHHKKDSRVFDTIMVDEALMVHAGQIILCAIVSQANKIVMR